MVNISAAMPAEFVELTKQIAEKLAEVGPNPLKKEQQG
jgi:coenzyme F420-reducing hydrogenase delta subunit